MTIFFLYVPSGLKDEEEEEEEEETYCVNSANRPSTGGDWTQKIGRGGGGIIIRGGVSECRVIFARCSRNPYWHLLTIRNTDVRNNPQRPEKNSRFTAAE